MRCCSTPRSATSWSWLFKALPPALLLAVMRPAPALVAEPAPSRLVCVLRIVLVALLGPIYQVSSEPGSFSAAQVFVAVHVLAIILTELHLFRRYDFVSMYSFGLAYPGLAHRF